MALHLVLSRASDVSSSARAGLNSSRISYYSESEEWSTIDLHPQFLKKFDYSSNIMCRADGLLCFYSYSDSIYVVWNPSTGKYQWIHGNDSTNIPCVCPVGGCYRGFNHIANGLGSVPESHDYKLVRFMTCGYIEDYSSDEDDDRVRHPRSDHVAVYSSKTSSWKELPFPFHFQDISPKYGGASTCVNGFIYWITSMDVILSFDLSTDKFSTLPFPDDIPPHFSRAVQYKKAHLLEFDGSLCLMIEFQFKKATTRLLRFWVYAASSSSWTRKINLDVRCAGVTNIPLWLGKKNNGGEFLMLRGSDGSVLEYVYTTRELKRIDLISPHVAKDNMIISPYVATNPNIANNKGGNGDTMDRISLLPDDLILCILSFLSLKEAASTTVLSTRWSDLWRQTPNLNFHDANVKMDMSKYIEWVNSVVESHKALSLKEFSITFSNYESTSSTVAIKWLEFAMSRRVEVLEFNFFGRRFAFLQKFLRKGPILKLANLRSLCLKCLKVSGRVIRLFLRNCPLLERLIIKSAVLKSDLVVCGSALKHLDIQYCEGGKSIKGYAPNLTSLKIDSSPFSLPGVDDHLNLAWATRQSADEPPLLPFISSQLTTLEFTLRFPPKGFFGNRFPQVPTLRVLIVTYLGGHGISPITSLICAFPYLEEFEIKCFRRIQKHSRSSIERQGMDADNAERFHHCHLRVFKFTWFDFGDGDHMELMSYILDNCVGLQKIILDIYGVDSPSYVAAGEYAKQLQSKLPTQIQLIISFNNRQLT